MKFTDHEKLISELLPACGSLLQLQRSLMLHGVELILHRGTLGLMEHGVRRTVTTAERKLVTRAVNPNPFFLTDALEEVSTCQRVAWMYGCQARDDFGDFLHPRALALVAKGVSLNGIEGLSRFYHSRVGLDDACYSPELPSMQLLRHVLTPQTVAGHGIEAFWIVPSWLRDKTEVAA